MRIGLIGRTADGKAMYDGQTVSTRLWRDELGTRTGKPVFVVDTEDYRHHILSILLRWLRCMLCCSHIVVMLSGNGLRFFLPLLYYSNKLFHRKLYHRVIGGELDAFIRQNPKCAQYLSAFEINWVQSHQMVCKLSALNVENGQYLENFRNIHSVPADALAGSAHAPFKFCTFSRVSKAKGITLAIEAVAQVNRERGEGTARLDVYGPLEEKYREEFEGLLQAHGDCVAYKGSVPSEQAVSILKDYFFHLFPTTWKGEGFPGTLLDCYHAGLPTIASTWAYNEEFVEENVTGYLYDWQKPERLTACLCKAIDHADAVPTMRLNCLDEAKKYQADTAMEKVLHAMGIEESGEPE